MDINFNILIDYSGRMGSMKSTKEEKLYLLPDGSTGLDLIKKILLKSVLPKLDFFSKIKITTFRGELRYDKHNKVMVKDNKIVTVPTLKHIYNDTYDIESISKKIDELKNPDQASTALYFAIANTLYKSNDDKINIIVISGGEANDSEDFDLRVLKKIKELNKKCKIHFIGINQRKIAKEKSRNLALSTDGVYVNLKAIDYNDTELELLLSNLNSNIIQQTTSTISIHKSETTSIEDQVKNNTQSLQGISLQLNNILKILKAQNTSKIEVIDNHIYNERIGRQAEEYLFKKLKAEYPSVSKVIWVNEIEEQSLPYDFYIEKNSIKTYFECKGTSSDLKEFQLTKNEWNFYLANKGNYKVCFVSNINTLPAHIYLNDLLEDMKNKTIIPCTSRNRSFKANRIVFQIEDYN